MNIEKILASNLINTAELARRLWPDNKNPKSKMSVKLSEKNGQRLTEKDKEYIELILKETIFH
jgi:hypothetical protein